MPLFDHRCKLGHTTELLRPHPADVADCAVCGNPAPRVAANRVSFGTPAIDARGMFRRFTEAGAEMGRAAERAEASTGQAAETPPLWAVARQRATAIRAAGESPYPKST